MIQPKVGHLGVLDPKSSNEAILEGERAAQAKIVAIQKPLLILRSPLLHYSQRLGLNSKK